MASSTRTFRMFVEEELGIFPHFLLWAVLEWMLIISLYLDGFFTFISNKFADTFELDPPCVLCTRVDHALCGKNPNLYYNDSICDSHKKVISSLAYCHVHRKLSDIRTMCESCLLSFAIENNSDSDNNIERDTNDRKPPEKKVKNVNNKHKRPRAYDPNLCSCCGESLKPKQPTKEYSRSLSSLRASSLMPTSSPRASALFPSASPRAFSTLGPMASPRAFSLLFPTSSPRAFSSLAPMCSPRAFSSQNRYTEFKFANDNEPDLPEDYSMNMKHSEEMTEDLSKTFKGNKFFGIPLTEAVASPRWAVKPPKKAAPSDKTDSALETNEDDEYSLIQQLKKQVSDNRKTLVTLYMELDEERSAATVAANNAMAMITRLQAEKVGVHMEALQYQRLMDEQAEYDEEAIQILKDLLLRKEEDAKVLEAKLDRYRERYGEIKKPDSDEYDEYYDDLQPRLFGDKYESWSVAEDHNVDDKKEYHDGSSVDFETKRCQLFGTLKDIEDHIHSSSQEDRNQDDNKGDGDNATLRRKVNQLREKLAAIEAESGFLKHTAMALEKGDEGTKLLTEIAEHLRKLQS
ncbi:putative myosin-binding protein 6 [Bidens hawaiensis]|uniref:putative myosin-binding protein 6 n=1 Tax=Bidens hawaiensis TaxID=980011 RepID=UPI00404A5A3D